MMLPPPSVTIARMSSMPLMAAIDSSSGRTTCDVTSSGLAPGKPDAHVDRRRVGPREQIDAEVHKAEHAQHNQEHDQHEGEDWPLDADFR